jgi:hypothetical protein
MSAFIFLLQLIQLLTAFTLESDEAANFGDALAAAVTDAEKVDKDNCAHDKMFFLNKDGKCQISLPEVIFSIENCQLKVSENVLFENLSQNKSLDPKVLDVVLRDMEEGKIALYVTHRGFLRRVCRPVIKHKEKPKFADSEYKEYFEEFAGRENEAFTVSADGKCQIPLKNMDPTSNDQVISIFSRIA